MAETEMNEGRPHKSHREGRSGGSDKPEKKSRSPRVREREPEVEPVLEQNGEEIEAD